MAKPKVIRRRTSNKPKAKSQQRRRRADTLFRKAFEFSQECDADVMLVFRLRKNGQIYLYNSDEQWFPSRDDLVCIITGIFKYANSFQELTYPVPLRITSRELAAKYGGYVEGTEN
ncbi:hypothetical protein BDW71DRAFT_201186 [Aspergillus fruticulosus]